MLSGPYSIVNLYSIILSTSIIHHPAKMGNLVINMVLECKFDHHISSCLNISD